MTGKVDYVMTVARTLLRAPFANVKLKTSYFSGAVEALCLKDPLCELIIGNIPGARAPCYPDKNFCMKVPAVQREQTNLKDETKPLKVSEVIRSVICG